MSNVKDKRVAFIGLGIMGSRMAANLLSNGVNLSVYNRSMDKANDLGEKGATIAKSIGECVKGADIIFSMLSTPEVVRQVAFGQDGIASQIKEGALWVDSSTIDPGSAKSIGEEAEKHNIRYVEAPVAGTKQPAEKGELVFFAGGNKPDIEEASPYFDIMGKKTAHLGEIGKGASMKMLINLMLAQSMLAFSETINLGKSMGLDQGLMHNVLLNTPVVAPFLQVIKEKLENNDFTANFPLKWMAKDLNLVSRAAQENKSTIPSASLTREIFDAAVDAHGDDDFSTIYHVINS